MISFVVPVYNVEKYLDECILSIMKLQKDIEIVLVDDGSTDQSGTLCDRWAMNDSRIKVVHKENGGLSSARNAGILASRGEYIVFVDSDDFIDPIETECLLSQTVTQENVLVGFYRNYYTASNYFENETSSELSNVNGIVSIESFLKTIPNDGQNIYMTAWRFIVKRDFLISNQLFFMEGIYHEDEEWTQRLLCKAESICVAPYYFYQYRQAREGAITSKVRIKNLEDRFLIMEKTKEIVLKGDIGVEKREYLKYRMAQLYLSNMIDCCQFDKYTQAKVQQSLKCFKKDCSKYMCGKIGTITKISEIFLGTKVTCCLLGVAKKLTKGK